MIGYYSACKYAPSCHEKTGRNLKHYQVKEANRKRLYSEQLCLCDLLGKAELRDKKVSYCQEWGGVGWGGMSRQQHREFSGQ